MQNYTLAISAIALIISAYLAIARFLENSSKNASRNAVRERELKRVTLVQCDSCGRTTPAINAKIYSSLTDRQVFCIPCLDERYGSREVPNGWRGLANIESLIESSG